jgi:glutamate:Na+ symporter, ESS family
MEVLRDVAVASLILALLILVGRFVRSRSKPMRDFFIPSSLIAGFLGLLVGPQVLGALAQRFGGPEALQDGLFPEWVGDIWGEIPGLAISVVFAALFLGKKIPKVKKVLRLAGPQVAFAHTLAWGQYVLGILAVVLLLNQFLDVNPMAGALLEVGMTGGHGTIGALADNFDEFDFPEGEALGMGIATAGVLGSLLIGIGLVNWAVRKDHVETQDDEERDEEESEQDLSYHRDAIGRDRSEPTDSLTIHLAIVGLAILIGWLLQQGLILLEEHTWGGEDGLELMAFFPLFPLAMVGGWIIQIVADKFAENLMDRELMNHISGVALDVIIVSAIATLALDVIAEHIWAFGVLVAVGLAWNIVAIVFLARRMIPKAWFEKGVGDFGQSVGMAVAGLLLIKTVDPNNATGARDGFTYKQLLFEPVLGGGLFTAASIPLIAQIGHWPVFAIALALFGVSLATGLLYFGRQDPDESADDEDEEAGS